METEYLGVRCKVEGCEKHYDRGCEGFCREHYLALPSKQKFYFHKRSRPK